MNPMLTIFAIPRAFRDHFGIIQRNAITSWLALEPRPEILLFGNDAGTAEICREFGLHHVPAVDRTPYDTPLVSDLFGKAANNSTTPFLCYVNSDIILLDDFNVALRETAKNLQKFLLLARRWDISINNHLDFTTHDQRNGLRNRVALDGKQATLPGNSDFFVFPRGLWASIPQFGLGRGAWDSWMVYEARRLGAAVVDASSSVMPIHQSHDQSAYSHGLRRWRAELDFNYQLAGESPSRFCLYDASHLLTPAGLSRPLGPHYLARRIDTLPVFNPKWSLAMAAPRAILSGARLFQRRKERWRDPIGRMKAVVHSRLPRSGVTSILGLLGPDVGGQPQGSNGLQLAYSLIWGSFPVVVYDPRPQAMEQARKTLGGPVRFASSVVDCVSDSDVIVIASPCSEFNELGACFASISAKRQVIDACNFFQDQAPSLGLQYARC